MTDTNKGTNIKKFKKKIPALFSLYSFTSNIVVIKQKRKSPPIKENIMIRPFFNFFINSSSISIKE